ncbi:hypothetical protein NC652_029576 [Populus alba x Populus x berolinensis]|nr:hypothetical protein NC652_029576 [Populus alba x Populus x berolinensis]
MGPENLTGWRGVVLLHGVQNGNAKMYRQMTSSFAGPELAERTRECRKQQHVAGKRNCLACLVDQLLLTKVLEACHPTTD